MFTDTHSHIHFSKEFPDALEVIERALAADVGLQILVGCTPEDSRAGVERAKEWSGSTRQNGSGGQQKLAGEFYCTLGVHPHHANELTDEILEEFETLAGDKANRVVGLGELGLDYFRNLQPHDVQEQTMRKQLQLAKKLDLAVVVHIRDAWEDGLRILKEEGNKRVVLHCFTGDLAVAREAWSRGYYTSFSGVVTYPKNDELREVAKQAPSELMLIETDCPYLPPQSMRGKRNEPAYVALTAAELASVRGVSAQEIGEITTANARKVFGIF